MVSGLWICLSALRVVECSLRALWCCSENSSRFNQQQSRKHKATILMNSVNNSKNWCCRLHCYRVCLTIRIYLLRVCLFACVVVCMCYVESLLYMSPRDWPQDIRIQDKCYYLLNRLACQQVLFGMLQINQEASLRTVKVIFKDRKGPCTLKKLYAFGVCLLSLCWDGPPCCVVHSSLRSVVVGNGFPYQTHITLASTPTV